MYAYKWEFHFTVIALGDNQSQVILEAAGGKLDQDEMLRRELFLLDSMLASGEQVEYVSRIKKGKPK